MKDQRISFLYIVVAFTAVVFSWLIHEFAHWLTYTLQGFDAVMGLNKAGVRGNTIPNID